VQAVDEHGGRHKWCAKELVDATGHDTYLASRLGLKKKNPKNVGRLAGRDAATSAFCGSNTAGFG
jgi:hypothetical protein